MPEIEIFLTRAWYGKLWTINPFSLNRSETIIWTTKHHYCCMLLSAWLSISKTNLEYKTIEYPKSNLLKKEHCMETRKHPPRQLKSIIKYNLKDKTSFVGIFWGCWVSPALQSTGWNQLHFNQSDGVDNRIEYFSFLYLPLTPSSIPFYGKSERQAPNLLLQLTPMKVNQGWLEDDNSPHLSLSLSFSLSFSLSLAWLF